MFSWSAHQQKKQNTRRKEEIFIPQKTYNEIYAEIEQQHKFKPIFFIQQMAENAFLMQRKDKPSQVDYITETILFYEDVLNSLSKEYPDMKYLFLQEELVGKHKNQFILKIEKP